MLVGRGTSWVTCLSSQGYWDGESSGGATASGARGLRRPALLVLMLTIDFIRPDDGAGGRGEGAREML